MGLKRGIVKVVDYDTNWIKEFEQEKAILKSLFQSVAVSIEHMGSTSIPGLAAKPIIDIAVGVKSLEDFTKVSSNFENPPYSIKEDSVSDEILVRKGPEDNRTHFIHIMEIDKDRYKHAILFRNYLRTHPDALKEYENLKKELAIKYPKDRNKYIEGKSNLINNILKKAKENNI